MEQGSWAILVPLFGTLITVLGSSMLWFFTQRSNRLAEERKRKEDRYQVFFEALRGFHVNSAYPELKDKFLLQLNLAWRYCPDEVIRAAYEFLETVESGKIHTDENKASALGRLVLAIRTDMVSGTLVNKTGLTAEDFKILRST